MDIILKILLIIMGITITISLALIHLCWKFLKPLFKKMKSGNYKPQLNSFKDRIFTSVIEEIVEKLRKRKPTSQEPVFANNDLSNGLKSCGPVLTNILIDAAQKALLANILSKDGQTNLYNRQPLLGGGTKDIDGSLKYICEESKIDNRAMCLIDEDNLKMKTIDTESPKAVQKPDRESVSRAIGTTLLEVGTEIAGSVLLPKMINHVALNIAVSNTSKYQQILKSDVVKTAIPGIFNAMADANIRKFKLIDKKRRWE